MNTKIIENMLIDTPIEGVFFKSTTDSTMDDAKHCHQVPSLHLTDQQTATRGRFRRPYYTSRGEGIYFSLVLQPSRPFEDLPLYTILTAVSVRKAIERTTGIVPKIKWVNDIYIGNKKVCGILSEGVANPSKQTFDKIVIGIGLNFSMSSFPEEIQHKATSLFPDGHPTISRETLVGEIVRTFFEYENKDFLTDYKAHSFVLGKTVQFVKNGNFYEGKATDISPSGELIVDIGDGLISLNSGEISLTSIEF